MRWWHPRSGFKYNLNRLPYAVRQNAKRVGMIPQTIVPISDVWRAAPNRKIAITFLLAIFLLIVYFVYSADGVMLSRMGALLVGHAVLFYSVTAAEAHRQEAIAVENFNLKTQYYDLSQLNPEMVFPNDAELPDVEEVYQVFLALSVSRSLVWINTFWVAVGTVIWGFGDLLFPAVCEVNC